MPVVRLALDATSTVVGYWSDGTANVEVTATLQNDGTLRLDRTQDITATCIADDDERRACREELSLSLPDGFAPASENFTLRLPMGATTLKFDYGENEPLTLDIDVPERILGVNRDVWECYIDRPPGGVEIDGEVFDGCGGWGTPTVQKWLNDVSVKVWATGDATHVAILETVLTELAPILDLEFEWVDAEEDADLEAFAGVEKADAVELGFDSEWALDAWGFGAPTQVAGGEVTAGRLLVWNGDLSGFPSPYHMRRSAIIHEALHALAPVGHTSRTVSIFGGVGFIDLSPLDIELLRLNSHPLVRPGMTMSEVQDMIVFSDELLNDAVTNGDDPLDLMWRAYVALAEDAGSASFRLSGGWIDNCSYTFGVRRGPIELSMGDFRLFGDDPALLHLAFHTTQFYIVYSRRDAKWTHWQVSPSGTWEKVDRETVEEASSYWLWNGKLLATIRSVLWDGSPKDIVVVETTDGSLRLQVTLDHSYVNMWDWTGIDSLDLTLVLDPESFVVISYTWELHRNPAANPNSCLTYKEVATDGRLGVEIDVPESIRNQLAASP